MFFSRGPRTPWTKTRRRVNKGGIYFRPQRGFGPRSWSWKGVELLWWVPCKSATMDLDCPLDQLDFLVHLRFFSYSMLVKLGTWSAALYGGGDPSASPFYQEGANFVVG